MPLDVCRLCLGTNDLFSVYDMRIHENMKNIIHTTTSVEIKQDDKISQKICKTCSQFAIQAFKFRTKAVESNEFLKKSLSKPENDENKSGTRKEEKKETKTIDKDQLTVTAPSLLHMPFESINRSLMHPSIERIYKEFPTIYIPKNLELYENYGPSVTLSTDEVSNWFKVANHNATTPVQNVAIANEKLNCAPLLLNGRNKRCKLSSSINDDIEENTRKRSVNSDIGQNDVNIKRNEYNKKLSNQKINLNYTSSDGSPTVCKLCKYVANTNSELRGHENSEHIRCQVCRKLFLSYQLKEAHVSIEHSDECSHLNLSFFSDCSVTLSRIDDEREFRYLRPDSVDETCDTIDAESAVDDNNAVQDRTLEEDGEVAHKRIRLHDVFTHRDDGIISTSHNESSIDDDTEVSIVECPPTANNCAVHNVLDKINATGSTVEVIKNLLRRYAEVSPFSNDHGNRIIVNKLYKAQVLRNVCRELSLYKLAVEMQLAATFKVTYPAYRPKAGKLDLDYSWCNLTPTDIKQKVCTLPVVCGGDQQLKQTNIVQKSVIPLNNTTEIDEQTPTQNPNISKRPMRIINGTQTLNNTSIKFLPNGNVFIPIVTNNTSNVQRKPELANSQLRVLKNIVPFNVKTIAQLRSLSSNSSNSCTPTINSKVLIKPADAPKVCSSLITGPTKGLPQTVASNTTSNKQTSASLSRYLTLNKSPSNVQRYWVVTKSSAASSSMTTVADTRIMSTNNCNTISSNLASVFEKRLQKPIMKDDSAKIENLQSPSTTTTPPSVSVPERQVTSQDHNFETIAEHRESLDQLTTVDLEGVSKLPMIRVRNIRDMS